MLATPQGYDFFDNEINGETFAVQRNTGEVFGAHLQYIIDGSVIYTPEQREYLRKKYDQKAKKEAVYTRTKGKKFFWTAAEQDYSGLDPAHMTRLIYLATYLNFEGCLVRHYPTQPITKAMLPDVLNISRSAAHEFYRAVIDKYLFDNEGILYMPKEFCFRGEMRGNAKWHKFFIAAVRELYRKTPATQHKRLGYVFKLLPYINREYNAICWNPDEQDMGKIEWMSLDDFCKLNGYSINQRARLLNEYKRLTFPTEDGEQVFCAFVTRGGDMDTAKIVVNPNVLYHGRHLESVEMLGEFCKPRKSRKQGRPLDCPDRKTENRAIS